MTIRRRIADLVARGVKRAQKKGDLPKFDLPEVIVELPRQPEWGDYAWPGALPLARVARMSPVKIGEAVVKHLPKNDFLAHAEVAHPGFVNFTLDDGWVARQVETILEANESFGNVDLGKGRRVEVEYVSANPTGPLTMGSGRNAVLGDGLANVLEAAGYSVHREYYVNDAGTQMRLFGETLFARYAQALGLGEPMPEDGYHGQYMVDLGREIAASEGRRFLEMRREEAVKALTDIGLEKMLASIREDLELIGVRFDNWFSERSIYSSDLFGEVMTLLRNNDHLVEREGAVWFAATKLGGKKDEVVIRSDGSPGYFASDIAYHYDKFIRRKFDWVIDVWGADHQGHVPRMKIMMQALGLDPDRLTLVIYQLVTLRRGGEIVRLSKRTGDIITLREVAEEIGADALRFFLLARSADSQMDLDLDLAKEQSEENPVYYVQYAHARIASILRYATEQASMGEVSVESIAESPGDVSLLTHPAEQALLRQMLRLPEVVEQAATNLAPHHLTYYAQDLARVFHSFYKQCRVVSTEPEDEALNLARLKLVAAAKIVLARTLHLMGMTAPERM
jgi:arginyl-tRNA synthetase